MSVVVARTVAIAAVLIGLLSPAAATGQVAGSPGLSSEQAAVSPGVVGYLRMRRAPDGSGDLLFAVFWRGVAGWHSGPQRGGGPVNPGTGSVTLTTVMNGTQFGFEYDGQARVMRIAGAEISLDTANVVLVDRVDGHGGPPFVLAATQTDPRLPQAASVLAVLVRRPGDIEVFVPDPYGSPD